MAMGSYKLEGKFTSMRKSDKKKNCKEHNEACTNQALVCAELYRAKTDTEQIVPTCVALCFWADIKSWCRLSNRFL